MIRSNFVPLPVYPVSLNKVDKALHKNFNEDEINKELLQVQGLMITVSSMVELSARIQNSRNPMTFKGMLDRVEMMKRDVEVDLNLKGLGVEVMDLLAVVSTDPKEAVSSNKEILMRLNSIFPELSRYSYYLQAKNEQSMIIEKLKVGAVQNGVGENIASACQIDMDNALDNNEDYKELVTFY